MSFKSTAQNVEEPVTVSAARYGRDDDTVTTHPAYAEISVSRISGRTNLFGSDFSHNGYVVVRIHATELHRSLSNDRYFAGEELIEVALSEAQWAHHVSSFNMAGTPCTLQRMKGVGRVPGLPDPKSRADQFGKEMQDDFDEAIASLDALAAKIEAATTGISKVKQKGLLDEVRVARAKLTSSAPFVADQFGEHMEDEMERAKIEIHGYFQNLVQRAGVTALGGPTESPIALPAPETDDRG